MMSRTRWSAMSITFEHIARIFVDKVVLPGITDQRQQFVTVFGSPWKSWLSNREKKSLLVAYRVTTV